MKLLLTWVFCLLVSYKHYPYVLEGKVNKRNVKNDEKCGKGVDEYHMRTPLVMSAVNTDYFSTKMPGYPVAVGVNHDELLIHLPLQNTCLPPFVH